MLAPCTRDGRKPLGTTPNDELLHPSVREPNLDAVRNQEQRAARSHSRDIRELEDRDAGSDVESVRLEHQPPRREVEPAADLS